MVLVASPRAIGSTPVANGSRVPACPTFAAVARRATSTTRLELMPSGLSMTSQPCGPQSSAIVVIFGSGGLTAQITLDFGPPEQGRNSICLIKRIVQLKAHVTPMPQGDFP